MKQCRRWTREEDRDLAAWYAARLSTREIARRLGRTGAAIRFRASRLGLRHPDKKIVKQHQTSDVIVNYEDLRVTLAAIRKQNGMSQNDFDDRAGLQLGYTGKLECGMKHYGEMSLAATLRALGIGLVVIPRHVFEGTARRVPPKPKRIRARRQRKPQEAAQAT